MSVIDNPYAPPQAVLSEPSVSRPGFFVVAPRKLVLMALLSQGLYVLYWSYKQWSGYRQETGAKIWPMVRAFFPVFFFYSLVMKVEKKRELSGASYRWWPRSVAIGLIVCGCLPFAYIWFIAPFTAVKIGICLSIVQIALAAQLQRAVNQVESDPEGEANKRLTWANGTWIVIGLCLYTIGIMSALRVPVVP